MCCRPVMPNQPYDWEKSGEMEREKTVIRVSGLKKYYTVGGATVRALDGVDLQVGAGEFLCISGRSGSGKSTMLSMLAGLDNPTAGSIEILGTHLERQSEEQRSQFRRKNIGFVFQSYNLMPQYTTLENVALPLAIRGVPEKKRNQAARWILSKVGLAEHVQHKPSELSGGQQQRAGIARAIITKPPIVLADEPTGNLDTRTSEEIMELLCGIFRNWGTTFLMVSHDPQMEQYTDRTIHFTDGRIERENSGGRFICATER